jgi:hypothetical protein
MKIEGQIKVINPTVQVSDKFAKREFVVTTNDSQYPQDILIQCVQANCSLLDAIQVNQLVEVEINLKGKSYEKDGVTRYFNQVEAWKITKL